MRSFPAVVIACQLSLSFSCVARAQKIEVDWSSNTSGQPSSWPTNLTRTEAVPFIIHNTNNLLYTYRVGGSCTQSTPDPWGTIAPVLTGGTTSGDQPPNLSDSEKAAFQSCSKDMADANAQWNAVTSQVDLLKSLPAPVGDKDCTSAKPCRATS